MGTGQDAQTVLDYCGKLAAELKAVVYDGRPLHVELDTREARGGDKVWSWIKKGVPVRLEVGPRDIASDSVFVGRRDKAPKDKVSMRRQQFVSCIASMLAEIQGNLLGRARAFRDANTVNIDSKDEFYKFFTPASLEKPEIHGGFALAHWCGDSSVEQQVKNDLNVTVRCIPQDDRAEAGTCIFTGRPSARRVVFAKAY